MVFKMPELRKHRALLKESEGQGQMNTMNSTEIAEHSSMTH